MRCSGLVLWILMWCVAVGTASAAISPVDSDGDGLSDGLEQRLLEQFRPTLWIAANDCSGRPAVFARGAVRPEAMREDGTLYGQVFPIRSAKTGAGAEVEVHFYHLWARDCGTHGHRLDAEHVAVLLQSSGGPVETATWTARHWYAAAHEDTVCDVSQVAAAATLRAETHGAVVWVSPGKHASYLDREMCAHGCGADRCQALEAMTPGAMVNLGEVGAEMNESTYVLSGAWPLRAKMERSDFGAAVRTRAEALRPGEIAWSRAGRHPVQGVLAVSASTEAAMAAGGSQTTRALGTAGGRTTDALGTAELNTTGALGTAGDSTTGALATAGDKTGAALGTSYRKTKGALGRSARGVGRALGLGKSGPKE